MAFLMQRPHEQLHSRQHLQRIHAVLLQSIGHTVQHLQDVVVGLIIRGVGGVVVVVHPIGQRHIVCLVEFGLRSRGIGHEESAAGSSGNDGFADWFAAVFGHELVDVDERRVLNFLGFLRVAVEASGGVDPFLELLADATVVFHAERVFASENGQRGIRVAIGSAWHAKAIAIRGAVGECLICGVVEVVKVGLGDEVGNWALLEVSNRLRNASNIIIACRLGLDEGAAAAGLRAVARALFVPGEVLVCADDECRWKSLPSGVNTKTLVFALLGVHCAHMAAQKPGVLPVLVARIAGAVVTTHLAALDGESTLGRPVMNVSLLAATHLEVGSGCCDGVCCCG